MADPDRLAQALDNLICNAIHHGGLRVSVDASLYSRGVRVCVVDSGGPHRDPGRRGDPRHGHGLRVVSTVAAEHGGRFLVRSSPAGTRAILELPFAPDASPAAAAGRAG
jgi:two-component system sensor histidine kinase TctE